MAYPYVSGPYGTGPSAETGSANDALPWWQGGGASPGGFTKDSFAGGIGDLLYALGGFLGNAGVKPPKQVGWETLFPTDSSGNNIYNLNQFTNDQNFWKKLGFSGGAYNPTEGLSNFFQQNGVAGDIAGFISGQAKTYDQLLQEQARSMVNPTMENIAAGLSQSGNVYSGAFGSQAAKALTDISMQSGLASEQQKFSMLAYLLPQLAGQTMSQYQQMWAPEWTTPTIAPKYDKGQPQQPWQEFLGGGMQIASLLAQFLPMII